MRSSSGVGIIMNRVRLTMMKTMLLILAAVLVLSAVPAANAQQACGCLNGVCWGDCGTGLCCGPNYYCGTGDHYCGYRSKHIPDGRPRRQSYSRRHDNIITDANETVANAQYARFFNGDGANSKGKNGWDLKVAGVSCAASHADMTLAWRQRYAWAALCGTSTTTATANEVDGVCGRCLKVTNRENGEQATVRIVDRRKQSCINGSLTLDYQVFQQLDAGSSNISNGTTRRSYLPVSYKFLNCSDRS